MEVAETPLRCLLESLESGSRPKGGVRGIAEGVPSLGGEHVGPKGELRLEKMRFVPEAFHAKMRQGSIRANDILIVKDGATTGRVALVPSDFELEKAVANEHLFVCRASADVLPEYLFYFLLSPLGQQAIMENFRGAAQGGIVQSFADEVTVPLPSRAAQEEIAASLRDLLASTDRIEERLRQVGPRVEAAGEAVTTAFFRGDVALPQDHGGNPVPLERLTEVREAALTGRKKESGVLRPTGVDGPLPDLPPGWAWGTLDQLIATGPQNGLYKPRSAYGHGEPIVRIEDFQNGSARPRAELSRVQVSESESRKYGLRPGDIVINRVNSPSHLGKSFLVTEDLEGAIFESNMMRLRVVDEVSPTWVARYLQSRAGRESLLRGAKWAVNQASINQTDVRGVTIPLPPRPEQIAVMEKLDEARSQIESVLARAASAESMLAEARKQLLSEAFVPERAGGC